MDCGTPTASLLAVKLLLNSVISTDSARFMSIDTKDFYLNTSMERPEFLRLNIKKFPEDVIQHYSQVKPLHRMCQRNVWLVSCGHNCAETAGGEIEPGRYYQSARFNPIQNGARSTTIIGPHVACLRASWGTLSSKSSLLQGDFVAR